MFKILIVEDEVKIRKCLVNTLSKWQYEVIETTDFSGIMQDFSTHMPHLVILDINLPQYDGFHWCRKIREISSIPILFTSSRSGQMDVIMGLHLGADDYLYKPYDLEILLVKINAMIRRAYAYQESSLDLIEHQGAILNLKDWSLSRDGVQMPLTKNEFLLLQALLRNKDSVVSREILMRLLWEDESFIDDNTLTVNMNRLRKKLEEMGLKSWIQTKKKQGYMLSSLNNG